MLGLPVSPSVSARREKRRRDSSRSGAPASGRVGRGAARLLLQRHLLLQAQRGGVHRREARRRAQRAPAQHQRPHAPPCARRQARLRVCTLSSFAH